MNALKGFGELGLGSRLKRLSEHMMKDIQAVYNHFNIDFDPYLFPIIKIIDNYKGVTNSQIKDSLQLSQPAITQAINKLIKKELIVISNDEHDGRKKIVSLSEKGTAVVDRMRPLWTAMETVVKQYTQFTSSSLIEHINTLEAKLEAKSLKQDIIDYAKAHMKQQVEIVNYKDAYAPYFYALNIEWLKTYFYVEDFDEEVLSKPDQYIINKGGHIFFAKLNDTVVGTVALMPTKEPKVFELTKMAVSPEHRGYKIGQKLMQQCIDFAKASDWKALMLYSNTLLENAIYIYRKYGFIEVPVEPDSPYERSNIKMRLDL